MSNCPTCRAGHITRKRATWSTFSRWLRSSAPQERLPARSKPGARGPSPAAGQVDAPAIRLSGSVREYTGSLQGGAVAFSYPEEWHVEVNPDASLQVSGENGTVGGALGCGVLVSSVPARNGKVELPADTKTYLQSLAQAGRNVKDRVRTGRTHGWRFAGPCNPVEFGLALCGAAP